MKTYWKIAKLYSQLLFSVFILSFFTKWSTADEGLATYQKYFEINRPIFIESSRFIAFYRQFGGFFMIWQYKPPDCFCHVAAQLFSYFLQAHCWLELLEFSRCIVAVSPIFHCFGYIVNLLTYYFCAGPGAKKTLYGMLLCCLIFYIYRVYHRKEANVFR